MILLGELVTMATLLKDIGMPYLFFAVMLYIIFKVAPDFLKSKREAEVRQQEYYNQRQKTYDDQMNILVKVAEQGNQVIARSNLIIEHNTEAIKQNTVMHNKVVDALGRDFDALKEISLGFKTHDERAQKIYTGMERLLDRTDGL